METGVLIANIITKRFLENQTVSVFVMKKNRSKYEKFRVKICPTCNMEIELGWDLDYKDNVIPVKKCGCNVD
jgi:hypothetical protein